jgi:hypothetical protein
LRDLDQAAAMQQLLDLGVEPEDVAETVHTTPENVRAWADLLRLPRKVRRLIEMVNDPKCGSYTLSVKLACSCRIDRSFYIKILL